MTDNRDNIDEIIENIKTGISPAEAASHPKLEFTLAADGDVSDPEPIRDENTASVEAQSPKLDEPSFSASEIADAKEQKNATSGIWTTYVPRFTEVSDNYRMAGSDKTVRPQRTTKVEAVKEEAKQVEPTAELDSLEAKNELKVVTIGASADDNYDIQATVFKFDVPDEPQREPIPFANEVVAEAPLYVKKEEEVVEEQLEDAGPKEYSIPDPEDKPFSAMAPVASAPAVRELSAVKGELAPISKFSEDYTAYAGRDGFKDKFLDTLMSIKIRLFASVFVFVLAFLLEVLGLFEIDVAALLGFSSVVGALAVIDAIFTTCLFLLAIPETVNGLRALVRKKAVPELLLPISYAILMTYYLTVAFLSANEEYSLFGIMFALLSLGAIVANLYKKQTDFTAFKAVSTTEEKTVMEKYMTRTLPEESIAVDGKVEGYKSKLARASSAKFVTDFFKRAAKHSENSRNVLIVLSASVLTALVSGLVAFFLLDGALSLVSTLATVFMVSAPVLTVLSHKLPYYYAQKEAALDGTAIIGEATLYDCAGVDVMCFDDTDVFNPEDINLQRIMLYGKSENLTKALRQMSSLFSVVGGPLEHIFADSLDYVTVPAANVKVEEEGIVGECDGKTIMAGSLEFMTRKGVAIPSDPTQEKALLSTKVMYAAEDGQVYAKFYIRYTLSEDFTMLLPSLCDDGILPLVYTRDPNVSCELFRTLTAGSDSIRVYKKTDLPTKGGTVYERASTGVATASGKTGIINSLFTSKKYARFQARIAVTELSAMVVGATLAVVLALAGITVIPSVVLACWQAAWCGVLFFLSKRTFNTKKNKENK